MRETKAIEKINLKILNRNNLNIFSDLYIPTKISNSDNNNFQKLPLIIFTHGFSGVKDTDFFNYLCENLTKENFICFKFDFTNNVGISEGDFKKTSIKNQIEDLEDIFKYFDKNKEELLNYIDLTKIILVGHSMGGLINFEFMNYLEKKESKFLKNIICSISLSTPFNIKKEVFEIFGTSQDEIKNWQKNISSQYYNKTYQLPYLFYEEIKKLNISEISKIKNHKLIGGNLDRIVPISDQENYYKLLKKPKEKIIIENLTHFYKDEIALKKVKTEIQNWIQNFLKD